MTQISLKDCSLLTDKAIIAIAEKCAVSITSLDLTETSGITDQSLIMISQWYIVLKFLYLSYCYLITDIGVSAIIQKCRRLCELDVSHCSEVKNPFSMEIPKLGSPSSVTCVNSVERIYHYVY